MFKISHNFRYMMANGYIYDTKQDQSFHIDSLNESFWINFYKENIISSFIHEMYDEIKIKSILRELNNTFSEGLNENFVFRQNLTIEKTLDTKFDKENITSIVESIFDSLGQTIILQEENWFSRTWGKVKSGVSNAFNWIKDKGLDYFFEGLRDALFSWTGVAVQIFLGTVGTAAFGIGPIINEVVWSLMLTYDLFKATTGDLSFDRISNIILDIISIATAGTGGGVVSKFLKSSGNKIIGKLGATAGTSLSTKIASILNTLKNSKVGGIVSGAISKLINFFEGIFMGPLKKAGEWFTRNFKTKWVENKINKVGNFLSDIKNKLSNPNLATRVAGSKINLSNSVIKRYNEIREFAKKSVQGKFNPGQGTREKWIKQAIDDVAKTTSLKGFGWKDWLRLSPLLGIGGGVLWNLLNDDEEIKPEDIPPTPPKDEEIQNIGSEEETTTIEPWYEGDLCSRTLQRGRIGDDVEELQTKLNSVYNFELVLDGKFGPLTKNAVMEFQRKNQLEVDGIFDENDCEKLNVLSTITTTGTIETTIPTAVEPEKLSTEVQDTAIQQELQNKPEEVIAVVAEPQTDQLETDEVAKVEATKKCKEGKTPVLVKFKEKQVNRGGKMINKTVAVYRCKKLNEV